MRFAVRPSSIALTLVMAATWPVCADAAVRTDADLALLDRLTWGATATDVQQMRDMGAEVWLQAQLHPPAKDTLPPAAQALIDAMPIANQTSATLARDLAKHVAAAKTEQAAPPAPLSPEGSVAPPQPTVKPATSPQVVRNAYLANAFRQDQTRYLLHALYSPNQLREQMVAFWINHFSIYANKAEIRLFAKDYEDQAIRPHAMGRFRDLLEATLRAPAMLQYLDNDRNAKGRINENYAREIMELHTLGVGSGYSQKDVQELARILTGVGIVNPNRPEADPERLPDGAIRDGMFAFYPARHDMGEKHFMGHTIKGSGYDEVRQALDILCAQPATARHVSRQLAQYFVAENPPASLVDRMAARWSQTGGDIAAVLDLLFHSAEFRASLAHPLLKDPQHFVLSAVRLTYDGRTIANTQPITNWLNRLGQPLYGHLTPDGYPLERTAWNGPGQIEQRFEIAQAIGSGASGLFSGNAPPFTPPTALVIPRDTPFGADLNSRLSPATRAALDQATGPREWNVLFLCSPEFMGR